MATDIMGVSGRAMLEALIAGERDVHMLAGLAKARMRPKNPALVEALTGNFGEHHAFLCRLHLERIDHLTEAIRDLSARIEQEMRPFARQLELLAAVPGVGRGVAEVIIAETGGDMTRFRTAGHLAFWAGSAPATTNPPADTNPADAGTATDGWGPLWAPRLWPPPAPGRPPTSAPATDAWHPAWAKRKRSSPSNTPS
ncbi:transposase [Streptomyces sp. NPDC002573]|uniref:transposase n=1 Tax=Streptomyces sp. NPDC002573 TaxID=3364651 RepID=UPI0036B2A344